MISLELKNHPIRFMQLLMNTLLIVALGGALGATARFVLAQCLPSHLFQIIPLPILLVNILGCFVMGFLTDLMAFYWPASLSMRYFLVTGFLGGFTTFSAFSLEYSALVQKGNVLAATLYVMLSFGLSILGFQAGSRLVVWITH